jgi:hypothetical protein
MAMDELKNIWQKNPSDQELSDEYLSEVKNKKPMHIIDKIKKTIMVEHYLNMVVFPLVNIWLFIKGENTIGIVILLFGIFSITYYSLLIKSINRISFNDSLKQYLKQMFHILKRFVNHYKIISYMAGLAGFIFGVYWSGKENGSEWDHLQNPFTLIALVVGASLVVLAIRYVIKILYGNKLKNLKQSIDLLNEV